MTAGIKANADGSAAIQVGGSDAITITSALNTTFAGTANVATGALYPIVSGTSVSASGTSVNFTGIPSWVKRITVMFNEVSTSGSSNMLVQVGSGSITNTGYISTSNNVNQSSATAGSSSTAGFIVVSNDATFVKSGAIVLYLISANIWISSHTVKQNTTQICFGAGSSPNLSGALDRVRITTVNGTDTFDAGTINILYE